MNKILAGLLACCAMVCTSMGLSNIIVAGEWQWHMVGLPVLVTAGMLAVIAASRTHHIAGGIASIVVGLLVWVCYLTNLTGSGVLPTPQALDHLASCLRDAVLALPTYGRPAPDPDLFVPLGMIGLGPMCVLAVFLAVVARSPASVGIPVLGCWVVFMSGGPDRGLGWALASCGSYLLILGLSPRKGKPGRFRGAGMPVVALAAVAGIVSSIVVPLAPGWGQAEQWLDFWNGNYTDNTGLNVNGPIQVGDSLRSPSSTVLFHTQGEFSDPLKMGVLDRFTGTTWVSSRSRPRQYEAGNVVWGRSGSPTPGGGLTALGPEWGEGPSVAVRIDQLSGQILPSGDGPRSITSMNGFSVTYDWSTDSFRARAALDAEDSYVTNTMVLDRSALQGVRAPVGDTLLGPGLTEHAEEITELTRSVIGSAASQDDQLLAIEAYLRGPEFTYTLTPKWENHGDPVWDFLQAKQGYCVHFATAMAVMGMSVGISMHVAVGYLPGAAGDDGWSSVTAARAHMWPEAYFAGIGWVRYEPTPAVATDDEEAAATDLPTDEASESDEAAAEETQAAPSQQAAAPTGPGLAGAGRMLWPLVAGTGAVGVGLLALLAYVRLYSPERAWRAILRAGVKRGCVTEAMSVRKAVAVLERRLDPSCAPGLDSLRESLEASRYGPADFAQPTIPGSQLWKLRRTIRAQLRSRSS